MIEHLKKSLLHFTVEQNCQTTAAVSCIFIVVDSFWFFVGQENCLVGDFNLFQTTFIYVIVYFSFFHRIFCFGEKKKFFFDSVTDDEVIDSSIDDVVVEETRFYPLVGEVNE